MRYAFIVMGDYDMEEASIHGGESRMIGVSDLDRACDVARELKAEGVDCIELCGAFGADGARRVAEATGHEVAVGYVVHDPDMDPLFRKVFG